MSDETQRTDWLAPNITREERVAQEKGLRVERRKTTESSVRASRVKVAGLLPSYTRQWDTWDWDWVGPEPILIPPGHRIIAEVTHDGEFSIRREKL
jgi:hypothetical protein